MCPTTNPNIRRQTRPFRYDPIPRYTSVPVYQRTRRVGAGFKNVSTQNHNHHMCPTTNPNIRRQTRPFRYDPIPRYTSLPVYYCLMQQAGLTPVAHIHHTQYNIDRTDYPSDRETFPCTSRPQHPPKRNPKIV